MKAATAVKTWEKTRLQNLVRHKSGRYYARLFQDGKEIWKSLKTNSFTIAESRLGELKSQQKKQSAHRPKVTDAKLTFGQAAALHVLRIEQNISMKRNTRKFWKDRLAALLKHWSELEGKEVRKITPAACRTWAATFAECAEPSTFNNTVAVLRHVFDAAIEQGVIYANPTAELERMPIHAKKLELPTLAKFGAFIAEMRKAHSRDSQNCADLAEGLAFTGCRISEAGRIQRADLDFDVGEITVRGDPEEGTKNGLIRRVPMIPAARKLFEKMMADRPDDSDSTLVFLVHECQKSMDRAAKLVGMKRITHHDLRHFFATICIESGVDIPTVSRWLGHQDGGVLAMKTYGHLRREHSIAQAQKVSFTPAIAA